MSQSNASNHDESDSSDSYAAWEEDVLAHMPSLPWEIQLHIASLCDIPTLDALCKVNKAWHAEALPRLWRHLDFVEAFSDSDLIDSTRQFFSTCDKMLDSDPERFATLASRVTTLDVGRLYGINIVHEAEHDLFEYYDDHGHENKRSVFDVIAEFKNLESLSVYIKSWWGDGKNLAEAGRKLGQLTNLKSVMVGGQMPPKILEGIAARGPGLKDLTLVTLIQTPGQDDGPYPVTFLTEDTCKGFTSLETLHLVKLADLQGPDIDEDGDSEDVEYPSGMRWRFPREEEVDVLEEWALLLRHTSGTLRSITLENRYLCSYGWGNVGNPFIEPGETHPAEYGSNSIAQAQRILFPVFFNEKWPKLKELYLVGMGPAKDVHQSVGHLEPRVKVVSGKARFQIMMGDVTPESINTPVEFGYAWEEVSEDEDDGDSGDEHEEESGDEHDEKSTDDED